MFYSIPYNVDEIELFSNEIEDKAYKESFKTVSSWVHKFLCRRSPLIGREGAVCPNTQFGLTQSSIVMTVAQGDYKTVESIIDKVLESQRKFVELVEQQPELVEYIAVITSFPNLNLKAGYELIENVQSMLKSTFVKKGMMIGQFYLTCPETGIRNNKFYPLRSPEPLLVVRTMVKSDLVFIEKEPEYLPYYYKKFPEEMKSKVTKDKNKTLEGAI